MASADETTTPEVTSIDLQEGQTLSEYLRDISEKGKSEYVKERADNIIRECLPAAKKGELTHPISRPDAIPADVVEYLEDHGVTVKNESSRLPGTTYRYVLSWTKPEEKPEEEKSAEEESAEEKKDDDDKESSDDSKSDE